MSDFLDFDLLVNGIDVPYLTNEPTDTFQDYSLTNIEVYYSQERKVVITFSCPSIARDVKEARNEAQKAMAKKLPQLAMQYVNQYATLCPNQSEVVREISAFAGRVDTSSTRSPVNDPKERFDTSCGDGPGLLDIIDEMLQDNSYTFGPRKQRPGEIGPKSKDPAAVDSRFICVFCHAIFTRTSDLLGHLRDRHTRDGVDISGCDLKDADLKDILTISKPKRGELNRLRAFGRYTYADVKANNWDIKDWTIKPPRAPRSVDEAITATTPLKRKRNPIADEMQDGQLNQGQFLVPPVQDRPGFSDPSNQYHSTLPSRQSPASTVPVYTPTRSTAMHLDNQNVPMTINHTFEEDNNLSLSESPLLSEPFLHIGSHLHEHRRRSPVPATTQPPQSSPPDMKRLRLQ